MNKKSAFAQSPNGNMAEIERTIEALWRMESARLIARLSRLVRDFGWAEDLAHDALVAALESWPKSGIPDKPEAWLMTTAKNRALDLLRRNKRLKLKLQEYGREWGDALEIDRPNFDSALERGIEDDLLSLIFTTCHPVLSAEARVALTLKVLGGLSTNEIARAYLVSEAAIAQRLVRAKRTLTKARVPFEAPRGQELFSRLDSVLEVVYLIFNEGYAATSGDDWMRPQLCEEALRLGRVLAGVLPEVGDVHGLAALMELQASRIRSRTGPNGEPVLLLDQDRSRWDQLLIRRGLEALARAERSAADQGKPLGPYTLQAAIAACHARAILASQTDWEKIAALYEALSQIQSSPIVELNRAAAVAMAYGPQAGLAIADELRTDPALNNYHWLPSLRGDLLFKTGRMTEAAAEFQRAAELARNSRERALLLERAENSLAAARLRVI